MAIQSIILTLLMNGKEVLMYRIATFARTMLEAWIHPLFILGFYSFVALALLAPIASNTFIPGLADYVNHLAGIIEAKSALAEGQFPVRVAPDWGWRYPYFQFYSSTSYTFAALIYQWITPNNALLAYKITAWLALTLGGIYMYRLIYWFVKSTHAALLASLVYLMSPYYIIVINNFGDFSELIGLSILPAAIFYTLKRYYWPTQFKYLLQMSLAWYLLLTTHIITFLYSSIFIALLLALITIRKPRHWLNLLKVGIGYGFGCLLAMWYLGPVGLLGNQMLMSQTFAKSAYFIIFSPVLSQLVFPAANEFKPELIHNHPAIGWLILSAFAICTVSLFNRSQTISNRMRYWSPLLIILFVSAFFLIWSPINIWQWIPNVFMIGQYSWRLLDQTIWIGAIMFALGASWLFKNKLDIRHTIIGTIIIAAISSQWFPTLETAKIDLKTFSKKPYLTYNQNAYLINFNQNTHFVDSIDTIMLYSLMENSQLHLNTPYVLTRSLLGFATNPFISISGKIPEITDYKNKKLVAYIDNSIIATKDLTPGNFKWDILLTPTLNQHKTISSFHFQLKILPETNSAKVQIPVKEVILTGFLSPQQIIQPTQLEKKCRQQKTTTICDIDVPAATEFLELPIIYYPDMIHITLNGKKIPYKSMIYYNYLVPVIKPIPGKLNHIEIQFRGLAWANMVSVLTWCIWGLSALFLITKALFRSRLH